MTLPAAVLFDMDGLLVETESLWFRVETDVARGLGLQWSDEDSALMLGGPLGKVVDHLRARSGTTLTDAELGERLAGGVEHLMRTEPIHWQPGARTLLTQLARRGVPCALVSASIRRQVDAVLAALETDLPGAFVTTVAADDLPRTKPHPDPYLEAARRLGVTPADCVVLEDSPTGVAAGTAAGAYVVAVPHVVPIPERPGVRTVPTLEDVDPDLLGSWSAAWRAASR